MAKTRPQDQNLQPDQYDDLNERFYGNPTGPHLYIRHRMRALMLSASTDDALRQAHRGVRFGNFVAGWPPDDPLLDPAVSKGYVLAESVVLFHHAAEALMRMVLAHLGRPPCPWLEMRRLTFAGYKLALDELRGSINDEVFPTELMRIFYGSERPGDSNHNEVNDQWHDLADGIRDMLWTSLEHLGEEGELYNAAKHGLAAVGGEDQFAILRDGLENPLLSADGHCLTYLTLDPSPPRWMRTVSWTNAEERLALAMMASNFLENLWCVAKAHYTPRLESQGSPKILRSEILRQTMQMVGTPVDNVSVSMYLRYVGDGGFSGRVSASFKPYEQAGVPDAVRLGGDEPLPG